MEFIKYQITLEIRMSILLNFKIKNNKEIASTPIRRQSKMVTMVISINNLSNIVKIQILVKIKS